MASSKRIPTFVTSNKLGENITRIQILADIKADLDNKIKNNFFANQGQSDVFATGKKHHQEVLEYIKEKVLEDEDIDF